MKRAPNKPAGFKASALRPGRTTPSEIASLRQEFQQDGGWAQAELEGLEQEEAKQPETEAKLLKEPEALPPARPYTRPLGATVSS